MNTKHENKRAGAWALPGILGLLVLLFAGFPAHPQNINQVEYFFDADPGFGAGISVPVPIPVPDLNNLTFAAPTNALPDGFHRLFVRARDDNGNWSHSYFRAFFKDTYIPEVTQLNKLEYFFDIDPGFGSGVDIPVNQAVNLEEVTFNIDISSMPAGVHRLYVRARDEDGRWSITHNRAFLKEILVLATPTIVAAEYFIDTDPGFGNAQALPVSWAAADVTLDVNIDISSLQPGPHRLFVRVKDSEGRWSITHQKAFLNELIVLDNPLITRVEYFFDNDPGFGLGTSIPITPSTNLSALNHVISIDNLEDGAHKLYVRVQDENGRWSTTNFRQFLKQTIVLADVSVSKVEYFFDTDPGFGLGTSIPITPSPNLSSVNHVISINNLEDGFHKFYVRVQDEDGRWSITNFRQFLKQTIVLADVPVNKAEYFFDTDPGFGNAFDVPIETDSSDVTLDFLADLTTLGPGFHRLFVRTRDAQNRWSHVKFHAFYKLGPPVDTLPDLVAVEYFLDQDPGPGNGQQVVVNPGQTIPFLAFQINLDNVAFGQHFLFVRAMDAFGKWSLATRDTIFYYLDSLPTAMMSGPAGFCENSSGEFEVTLTGTPPWNLIYYNGEDTLTATGILTSPFVFSVTAGITGLHEARVLQVQDVYYTGLYTGVPIEYQVYPLPAAAGTIHGSEHLCQGTGQVWYWIQHVANATAYQWTYPAGVNPVSGVAGSSILLDFTQATGSGNITVTAINSCGPGETAVLPVEIHPLPVVDAGPDQNIPFEDSAVMAPVVTGGTVPYSYYWQPHYLMNNPYLPEAVAYPATTTDFTLYVTDARGCQSSDMLTVFVGLPPGTQVNGVLTYDNNLSTPLNEATILVKQGNQVVGSGLTGSAGEFSIPGLPAGSYSLSASITKAWGGVNATDALLVLQHFTENVVLTGLRVDAADVNATNNINAIDALLIGRRYTEAISSFPAGDWLTSHPAFYVPGTGFQTHDLRGLAYGDVNGSYIPAAKLGLEVELTQQGLLTLSPGRQVDIPLCLTTDLQVGALSLTLQIPQGVVVSGVKPARLMPGSNGGALLYHVNGNQLKIACYGLNAPELKAGDPLLFLQLIPASTMTEGFQALEGSSVANAMGQTIAPCSLSMPGLQVEQSEFQLFENYPNPFSTRTTVSFSLGGEAEVELLLRNSLGQTVKTLLHQQMPAGLHNILLEADQLSPGMYFLCLSSAGQSQTRITIVQ